MSEYQNKKILITGASKGIGFTLAQKLDKAGACLILHASSDIGINCLREKFLNKNHLFWQADFSKPESIESSLLENLKKIGSIDGYVNCVGIRVRRPLKFLNVGIIQEAMNTNFISFIEVLRIITKINYYNKGLSVVSISSISAYASSPGVSIYAATKGAIESATKSLAKELHKKQIRINTIVSGQVNTEEYSKLMETKESKEDSVLTRQYMGLLEAENIAQVCLFLLSEKSKFMNGTSFPADGGFLS